MELTLTPETLKFIKDVETLRQTGEIRFDSEIIAEIKVPKSNFSAVMNKRRNASQDVLDRFYKKYEKKLSDNKLSKGKKGGNAVVINGNNMMMVPLVSKYAYAGYLTGWGDDEYIENLPQIPWLVDKEYKGDYRAFEVKGDSMDNGLSGSYKEGYIVLGREISKTHWRDKLHIKKWKNFIVVTKNDGILIKEISHHDAEKGKITLHSLNTEYKDITVSLDDVAQLFNVIKFIGE